MASRPRPPSPSMGPGAAPPARGPIGRTPNARAQMRGINPFTSNALPPPAPTPTPAAATISGGPAPLKPPVAFFTKVIHAAIGGATAFVALELIKLGSPLARQALISAAGRSELTYWASRALTPSVITDVVALSGLTTVLSAMNVFRGHSRVWSEIGSIPNRSIGAMHPVRKLGFASVMVGTAAMGLYNEYVAPRAPTPQASQVSTPDTQPAAPQAAVAAANVSGKIAETPDVSAAPSPFRPVLGCYKVIEGDPIYDTTLTIQDAKKGPRTVTGSFVTVVKLPPGDQSTWEHVITPTGQSKVLETDQRVAAIGDASGNGTIAGYVNLLTLEPADAANCARPGDKGAAARAKPTSESLPTFAKGLNCPKHLVLRTCVSSATILSAVLAALRACTLEITYDSPMIRFLAPNNCWPTFLGAHERFHALPLPACSRKAPPAAQRTKAE